MRNILLLLAVAPILAIICAFMARVRRTVYKIGNHTPQGIAWEEYVFKTRWRSFALDITLAMTIILAAMFLPGDYVFPVIIGGFVGRAVIEVFLIHRQIGFRSLVFPFWENQEKNGKDSRGKQ